MFRLGAIIRVAPAADQPHWKNSISCDNTGRNDSCPAVDPHVKGVVRSAEHEIRVILGQRTDVVKRTGTIKRTPVGLADLFKNFVLNLELLGLVGQSTPR
jgi:hypothetical protein